MNIETRTQDILNIMTSCSKATYRKNEILPAMFELQKELVALTFNEDHAAQGDLKLWDVESHLTQLNEECGGAATEALGRFKTGRRLVSNLIKAEVSGNRGEAKALTSLDRIRTEHMVLKNIELSNEELRTELDAVVITQRGAFIIEVKNTAKDIFIDDAGDYYRTGEYTRLDCNILQKMGIKKVLLQEALQAAGLGKVEVFELLVFTNNRIEVRNHCEEFRPCFLGQLPFIIDEWNSGAQLSIEEIRKAAATIESARSTAEFPLDFDVVRFKMDFARVMAELEAANLEEKAPEIEVVEQEKTNKRRNLADILYNFFDYRHMKAAGTVAAVVVTIVTTVISVKNNN